MKYIPFHKPHIPRATYSAVKKVLDSGWLTTGPNVKMFEENFKGIIKSNHAIAVSSCTSALHLAYLANKFGPGDEVIVPSYTFVSTINTIMHTGAKPVFCEIDENTLCVDVVDIEKRITKKTKGIVVVHFAGMPADMDKINNLAKKHQLVVIEDGAHAFMTKYKGKYIGESNNTVCFSFYATKNLTTVEGGMITTNNNEVAEFSRVMSFHGISKNAWKRYTKEGSWRYDVIAPGYKYNMTDIQAVVGIEQLKHVKESVQKRQHLSSLYRKYFKKNPNIILPIDPPYSDSKHAWHLFAIRLTEKSKVNRDTLIELLKENEIGTSVHFIPNHLQSYYHTLTRGSIHLPVTEKVFNSIVSLPFFEDLTESQIKRVCGVINKLTV